MNLARSITSWTVQKHYVYSAKFFSILSFFARGTRKRRRSIDGTTTQWQFERTIKKYITLLKNGVGSGRWKELLTYILNVIIETIIYLLRSRVYRTLEFIVYHVIVLCAPKLRRLKPSLILKSSHGQSFPRRMLYETSKPTLCRLVYCVHNM